jgi:peptidoglycan/xylan/chitin deacetylase (PgdA/CDA1 family)
MRINSVLYHDVVGRGQLDASGFPGVAAARYKLGVEDFDAHLAAIGERGPRAISVHEAFARELRQRVFLLTFDDGGVSAATTVAPRLRQRGWRAHFFVTTDCIGTSTFVDERQIRELARSGHVIGSHSATHPVRMARLSRAALEEEWRRSVGRLSEILGTQVDVASVPGGYYSRAVGEAASAAGVRYLFTSEPTARVSAVDDCRVLGRYSVWRGMPPTRAAGFATGAAVPCLRQFLFWNVKKFAKAAAGDTYLKVRDQLSPVIAR